MKQLAIQQIIGVGKENVYVYHFESNKGALESGANRWPCKIGYTKGNVEKRIKEQQASMLEAPTISLIIKTDSGKTLESFIHARLKARQLKAFGTEWFMTCPEEIKKIINNFDKQSLDIKIGELIKITRTEEGFTQTELSEISGVSQEKISLVESGANVELKTIEKLCSAMNKRICLADSV